PGAGGRRPHWHLGRPVAAVEAGHCRALGGLRIGRLHKVAPASAGRDGLLLSLTAACRGGAVRASNVRCSTASHPPGLDSCRHRHHHLRGERPRCCWSAGCGLDVGPLAELASCTFPKARCVLLNAERVLYSDVKGVLGSVAAFLSIDMRRWLGVLEFLYVSPARVLIACLVSLAAIFAVDISTPRSDYFAILYIVPAATAAAALPSKWAAGALASALGLQ